MYLGVDGGGTKTAFCLLGDDGELLTQTRTASTYYLMSGIGIVEPLLRQGVEEVCRAVGTTPGEISHAFFGLPAYGEVSADVPELDAVPGRVLGTDRYACGNDMVCGWAGSLGGVDGINVVAGTGSIAYGENGGRTARAGGWGEVFGDEGSGYWVGVRGLNAFSRMADGRLPGGPLQDAVRRSLDLTTDLDVVDVVLNRWHGDRGNVAGLSRAVAEAADAGDPAALAILTEAGRELALLVDVQADRLGFGAADGIPVSFSGGMFTNPHVRGSFRAAVARHGDRYDLRDPLLPPHLGAAVHAARLAGNPLDAGQVRRLQSEHLDEEGRQA
ncbi:N-acetylglucosamine kinase [Kineococcus rubinsiae]|uniref:N-acetylglucosamine kinase n=1 Tax=Kineococcus rubinsiae TaxID=2609562 RepID=UPI0014314618|nr:BadF/BadG/BcrA/BcrD ATPase family protein [Kineococcus rubinsiae]NIZ91264.1 N-acetylglucosamine kinase [Kineococcus rubinsiae]